MAQRTGRYISLGAAGPVAIGKSYGIAGTSGRAVAIAWIHVCGRRGCKQSRGAGDAYPRVQNHSLWRKAGVPRCAESCGHRAPRWHRYFFSNAGGGWGRPGRKNGNNHTAMDHGCRSSDCDRCGDRCWRCGVVARVCWAAGAAFLRPGRCPRRHAAHKLVHIPRHETRGKCHSNSTEITIS